MHSKKRNDDFLAVLAGVRRASVEIGIFEHVKKEEENSILSNKKKHMSSICEESDSPLHTLCQPSIKIQPESRKYPILQVGKLSFRTLIQFVHRLQFLPHPNPRVLPKEQYSET